MMAVIVKIPMTSVVAYAVLWMLPFVILGS